MKDKAFVQPPVINAQQHFSQVPAIDIDRSTFDRSHGYTTTFDAGDCVPFFVDECLPGDTHNLHTTGFYRLATPLRPVMDNIYIDIHYFLCLCVFCGLIGRSSWVNVLNLLMILVIILCLLLS